MAERKRLAAVAEHFGNAGEQLKRFKRSCSAWLLSLRLTFTRTLTPTLTEVEAQLCIVAQKGPSQCNGEPATKLVQPHPGRALVLTLTLTQSPYEASPIAF